MSMHPAGDGSTINGGEVGICSRCCGGKRAHIPMNIQPYRKKKPLTHAHARTHTHMLTSLLVWASSLHGEESSRVKDHMRSSGHYSYTDSMCLERVCRAVKKGRCILYAATPCLLHTLSGKRLIPPRAAVKMLL